MNLVPTGEDKHSYIDTDTGEKVWVGVSLSSIFMAERMMEEKMKELKFRGKFQEACCSTKHWPYWTHWRFGRSEDQQWKRCQHCSCEVCEKTRVEHNLPKCVAEARCYACRDHEMKGLLEKLGTVV